MTQGGGEVGSFPWRGPRKIPSECSARDCNREPQAALALWPHEGEEPMVAWLCEDHADELTMMGIRPDVVESTCGHAAGREVRCGARAAHVVILEKGRRLAIASVCARHTEPPAS